MSSMLPRFACVWAIAAWLATPTAPLFAQGGAVTAPLSGSVVDTSRAVVPGASVTA